MRPIRDSLDAGLSRLLFLAFEIKERSNVIDR